MSLNCKEIDLIIKEANLEGAFAQKVVQPSYTSLVLGLYKNRAFNLFFSLEGSSCRFNLSEKRFSKPTKPLRFMELLRAKILGLKVESVKQINADRIVKFVFLNTSDNSKVDKRLFLYFKLWSGAANIILTDSENKIIDAFYRRPKKKEISGEFFLEAPPLSEAKIQARLAKFDIREYDKSLSFNEAIDVAYKNESPKVNVETVKAQLLLNLVEKIDKLKERKKNLLKELQNFENPESLKIAGDLILSNIAKINKSENKSFFEGVDYTTGKPVKILLDKLKTPQENATEYYTRSKKIISGKKTISENIALLKKQILELQSEQEYIKSLNDLSELKKLLAKKTPATIIDVHKKNKGIKNFSGLKFNIDGFLVLVGRSATENDELLRHCVRGFDTWLHVRDFPGAYVFIKHQKNKTVPLEVLLLAGNLAVFYSKAKKNGEATVYYTQVKNLRRAKNAKKGTVLPQNPKTLFIKLDEKMLSKGRISSLF
ncbi:MAG: NFACT RNA binding domain-containing protein [Treponemataceae bacterium]